MIKLYKYIKVRMLLIFMFRSVRGSALCKRQRRELLELLSGLWQLWYALYSPISVILYSLLDTSLMLFFSSADTTCKSDCVHGQCQNGFCVCDQGWTGPTCSSKPHLLRDSLSSLSPHVLFSHFLFFFFRYQPESQQRDIEPSRTQRDDRTNRRRFEFEFEFEFATKFRDFTQIGG